MDDKEPMEDHELSYSGCLLLSLSSGLSQLSE